MNWDLINSPENKMKDLSGPPLFSSSDSNFSKAAFPPAPSAVQKIFPVSPGPGGTMNGMIKSGSHNPAESMQRFLGSEGRTELGKNTVLSKDYVNNSIKLDRNDGYGLEQNADGSTIFKMNNGLETVRTQDGKIYMRDSKTGAPTGRELIK